MADKAGEYITGNQSALKAAGMETENYGGYGNYPSHIVDTLKKIERKNHVPMTGIDITFNSSVPAQMDAKAIACGGNRLEIGPGYGDCINHELGHIVQQRLGLVKATGTINGKKVNTRKDLELNATMRGDV